MNNEALVIVDALCIDSRNILTFIQNKVKGIKGEEHEILDSYPILYVRNEECEICRDLAPYVAEELIFDNGVNQAEQSYEEILELLDTTEAYVCGGPSSDVVCRKLIAAGFTVHML